MSDRSQLGALVRSVACIFPVLGRPGRVAPLLASLEESTAAERADGWRVRPVFVCSAGDTAEISAVRDTGAEHLILTRPGRAEYPRKINIAAHFTTDPWLLLGADDLRFHDGWLQAALDVHEATGALVVGTNDLVNQAVVRGEHATHSLVHRTYVELGTIDEPGIVLHEGYDHNSCDVEFTQTAIARGMWAFAERSRVQHLHPIFDRSVQRDATYNKGIRYAVADKRLCEARRRLWDPDAPQVRHRSGIRVRQR